MSTNELKALHDDLLAHQPEGATHDAAICPLCAEGVLPETDPGGHMPQTYTQEEVDTAISTATRDLQQRLTELEATVQQTEVGKAVEAAVAERDGTIEDLRRQLDDAVASRTAAEAALAETTQFWTDAIAAEAEAQAVAARRAQRVEAATAAGVLPADYIEANADRFAAMSDDDWQSRLDEWSVLAKNHPATAEASSSTIPEHTSLVASRAEVTSSSALPYIVELRKKGIDPKTLVGGN